MEDAELDYYLYKLRKVLIYKRINIKNMFALIKKLMEPSL